MTFVFFVQHSRKIDTRDNNVVNDEIEINGTENARICLQTCAAITKIRETLTVHESNSNKYW